MANVFVNIPVPVVDGAGAAVDVSTLGATKTIIVGGPFQGTVTIEYSLDPAALVWAPVPSGSFVDNPGRVQVDLVARWMRAVTSAYKSGTPNADVGAPAITSEFVDVTAIAVSIAEMPPFKTVMVSGPCNVEVSVDGLSYSQVFSFQGAGAQSATVVGQFARVTNGATCWMGAGQQGGGGADPVSNLYSGLTYEWVDDWCQSQLLAFSAGWNNIPAGSPPYSVTLANPASSISAVTSSDRVGMVSLRAGGVDGVSALICQQFLRVPTYVLMEYEAVVAVPTLSTPADVFVSELGFLGVLDGAWFRYDAQNHEGGNPGLAQKWEIVTSNAGVQTSKLLDGTGGTVDSPVDPAVIPSTNFYRMLVRVTASTFFFYINDVLVGTMVNNVTGFYGAGVLQRKFLGATAFDLWLDYTRLFVQLAAPRTP